ncbi:MAG: hypothetical protein WC217_02680 [Candidatus Paceibacterota bacterium]|jgi:hypothetical protein
MPIDEKSDLLSMCGVVELDRVAPFAVGEKFQQGRVIDGVNVLWVGWSFDNDFFKKVEYPVNPATFYSYRLQKKTKALHIIKELGSGTRDTALSQLWEIVKAQGDGQQGLLLTDGSVNIVFALNKFGEARTVEAYWNVRAGGWGFGSRHARDEYEFGTDVLVLAH